MPRGSSCEMGGLMGSPKALFNSGGFAGTARAGAQLLKETPRLNHHSEKSNPASPLPKITCEGFSLNLSLPSQLIFQLVH